MQSEKKTHGLLIVYTGDGKGKTTAALGQMLRARGWGLKTVMFQFIKSTGAATGEHRAARELGLDIRPLGSGFVRDTKDEAKAKALAVEQWQRSQEAILSGGFDIVILDEVSYPINRDWISLTEVMDVINSRSPELHVVLTGRKMSAELKAMADLVTEMKEVKHPHHQGVKAQKGIEY